MNSDIAQRDFGDFVGAVANRYKGNRALAGWDIGGGATGEDGYGPNYIALMAKNIDNLPKIEIESGTYTYADYSPFFKRKFKAWLKEKYSSDQKLQAAWNNDKSITLANVAIPKPAEMFQTEELPRGFPDPTDVFAAAESGTDGSEDLNAKGKDFYEFRNEVRRVDREFYASSIKKNDSSHILLLNGASDDLLDQSSDFDGIAFSMFEAIDKERESQSYFFSTDIARRAVKAGKLVVISDEHSCDPTQLEATGECENSHQLDFIEKLGKSVKCVGGIFTPTVGFDGKKKLADKDWWIPPIWFSDKAMEAAERINDFDPSNSCACSVAREMYLEDKCDSGSSQPGCKWFSRAYESLCSNNSAQQGKCGDGKCDSLEKSSGMCPEDCH